MKRYAIQIVYDGSKFFGWQKQVSPLTVQQSVENALELVAKQKILLTGSGRTDSGVHATCQMAHFDFPINMTTEQIRLAVRSKCPFSIDILHAWEVAPDFHARFDAVKRTYNYILAKNPNPFFRDFRSYIPRHDIKMELINQITPLLLGSHDFTSFSKPNPEVKNHICNIESISFKEFNDFYLFEISANRFLHNMVRRIIGALVSISHKKLPPDIILQWIDEKKQNQKNFFTAPPYGLYLTDVVYPIEIFPFKKINIPIY